MTKKGRFASYYGMAELRACILRSLREAGELFLFTFALLSCITVILLILKVLVSLIPNDAICTVLMQYSPMVLLVICEILSFAFIIYQSCKREKSCYRKDCQKMAKGLAYYKYC